MRTLWLRVAAIAALVLVLLLVVIAYELWIYPHKMQAARPEEVLRTMPLGADDRAMTDAEGAWDALHAASRPARSPGT